MRSPLTFENPNCAGADTEAFFPGQTLTTDNQAAKRVCASCIHQDECLTWALHHEDYGIWAGTTAHERDRMRRRMRIVMITPHLPMIPVRERAA